MPKLFNLHNKNENNSRRVKGHKKRVNLSSKKILADITNKKNLKTHHAFKKGRVNKMNVFKKRSNKVEKGIKSSDKMGFGFSDNDKQSSSAADFFSDHLEETGIKDYNNSKNNLDFSNKEDGDVFVHYTNEKVLKTNFYEHKILDLDKKCSKSSWTSTNTDIKMELSNQKNSNKYQSSASSDFSLKVPFDLGSQNNKNPAKNMFKVFDAFDSGEKNNMRFFVSKTTGNFSSNWVNALDYIVLVHYNENCCPNTLFLTFEYVWHCCNQTLSKFEPDSKFPDDYSKQFYDKFTNEIENLAKNWQFRQDYPNILLMLMRDDCQRSFVFLTILLMIACKYDEGVQLKFDIFKKSHYENNNNNQPGAQQNIEPFCLTLPQARQYEMVLFQSIGFSNIAITTRFHYVNEFLSRLGFNCESVINCNYITVKSKYLEYVNTIEDLLKSQHQQEGVPSDALEFKKEWQDDVAIKIFGESISKIKFGYLVRYITEISYYDLNFFDHHKKTIASAIIFTAYSISNAIPVQYSINMPKLFLEIMNQDLEDEDFLNLVIKLIRLARAPNNQGSNFYNNENGFAKRNILNYELHTYLKFAKDAFFNVSKLPLLKSTIVNKFFNSLLTLKNF